MKRGKARNRLLDFYIGVPVLNLLALLRHKRIFPHPARRIGIMVNPALGDTLLASAVTQDLRSAFPHSTLIFFAAPSNLAAARLLPEIDLLKVIPITRPWRAVRVLRQSNLDILVDFTAWQRLTALFSLYSGAKFVIGFARQKQFRHRGYDTVLPHLGTCHELENIRRITRYLGVKEHFPPRLNLPLTSPQEARSQPEHIVVFHAWATGTFRSFREWPGENWVELAKRLHTPQRTFLLTGGPGDLDRCEVLKQKILAAGIPVDVLIGRQRLEEVAMTLERAEMLISVNTGIMHLGAILGVPTIALNGPTSEHRWGPVGPRIANVPTSDGSGGFLDLGFEFRQRNVMGKISVDAVLEAVELLCPSERATGPISHSSRESYRKHNGSEFLHEALE